jgi:hypothetical protein
MLTATSAGQLERVYGLMAEFDDPDVLLIAAQNAHRAGYRHMDAYSPMPLEGLAEAIGFRRTLVERLVLVAAILGATGGFTLCWWMSVIVGRRISRSRLKGWS